MLLRLDNMDVISAGLHDDIILHFCHLFGLLRQLYLVWCSCWTLLLYGCGLILQREDITFGLFCALRFLDDVSFWHLVQNAPTQLSVW